MYMQSHVMVPLDGSAYAEAILPHALLFALQTQSVLTLLRVISPPGEPGYSSSYIPDDWYAGEVQWTKNYLASLAARLEGQGAPVQTHSLDGPFAGSTINAYAEQHAHVRVIALATHGRSAGGRLLLGSVAEDIFAEAPTSLLLLHAPKDEHPSSGPIAHASYQRIVVPLDGIVGNERVLEQATTLALACNAAIMLVADPPPPLLEPEIRVHEGVQQATFLAEQAERLRLNTALTVQTAFSDGDAEAFIGRLQSQEGQPLLIVTTRQQKEHKVMRFLHQSNVPVLFVA